jgi:hypothetical protein
MSDLLFDTPWWLPALLLAAGVVLFITGNNRQVPRLRLAGVGVFLLAVALILTSYFVLTPRERALANTRRLVTAFEKRDWPTFQSLLPDQVSLALLNHPDSIYSNRAKLVAGAKAAQDRYNFKNLAVTGIEAVQTDTLITVSLDVISEQEITMGRPLPSSWQFDWQETADGWLLVHITALKIANMPADQIRNNFPAP